MAISQTTDWSKIRYGMLVLYSINALLASTVATGLTTSGKQKRQLFREHLLPQQGGKIPDGAFRQDRLVLNKFQQNGLYSPDGYHLEQRHPERSHFHKQYLPNTLKINLPPDDRYVAPPGRYHDAPPHTVDTTYIFREPVTYVILPPSVHPQKSLPVFPDTSIRLLQRFKYHNQQNQNHYAYDESSWNEIPDEFPSQIFIEYAPYLRKLHDDD